MRTSRRYVHRGVMFVKKQCIPLRKYTSCIDRTPQAKAIADAQAPHEQVNDVIEVPAVPDPASHEHELEIRRRDSHGTDIVERVVDVDDLLEKQEEEKFKCPLCSCGLPSFLLTINKEGPNLGRYFHICSMAQCERCSFSHWLHEPPMQVRFDEDGCVSCDTDVRDEGDFGSIVALDGIEMNTVVAPITGMIVKNKEENTVELDSCETEVLDDSGVGLIAAHGTTAYSPTVLRGSCAHHCGD